MNEHPRGMKKSRLLIVTGFLSISLMAGMQLIQAKQNKPVNQDLISMNQEITRDNVEYKWFEQYAREHNIDWNGVYVRFTGDKSEEGPGVVFWDDEIDQASRAWFEKYAPYSSGYFWDDYNVLTVGSKMKDFQNESALMEKWFNENMEEIAPEGMGVEEAKVACYCYILNYKLYSTEGDNKSCYKLATEGTGACAAFSSLFRNMLRYLTFDENWHVTYDKDKVDETKKLDMLVIGGNGHAWNAMKDNNGTWKFYDATFDSKASNAERNKGNLKYYELSWNKFYTDEPTETNYGEWYRPEVEIREGLHVYISGRDDSFASGAAFDVKK